MEIERKYLVNKVPDSFTLKNEIEQGYINSSPTIRIRRSDDEFFLTVKGSGLLAREEFEMRITGEEYASLLSKVETRIIKKDRYLIPIGGSLTAELDIYHDFLEGLKTVEVEFESVEDSEAFAPPEWFGREVTYDKGYSNGSLARHGLIREG